MGEIWKPHVSVAAIIERDDRFLLVEEDIGGAVVFNQPAGHLDPGESLTAAVARETMEEAAWEFTPTALVGIYLMRIGAQDGQPTGESDRTYLRFAFCGELGAHYPERPLDKEIITTHWLDRAEIADREPKLRNRLVAECIDDYLSGVRLPLWALKSYGVPT